MKKNTFISYFCLLLLCLTGSTLLNGQALMEKVPLKTQIENSNLVVEGKVIAKKSTWDDDRKLIYTINTVEVYKVFKGNALSTIDVVTLGGSVGLDALIVNPSLKLRKGNVGVFILEHDNTSFSKTASSKNKKFKPSELSQSFYKYNLNDNLVSNQSEIKQNITKDFYNEIQQYTKSDFIALKTFDAASKSSKTASGKVFLPPGAISLDKTTVSGGTKDQLTITGTDFGSTQGKVQFRDADDGGASFIDALDSQIISWSDTQIVVEVPSGAGTGSIRVEDDLGGLSPLSSILTVSYSEINVETDPDDDTGGGGTNGPIPFTAYQVQHVDENASGGMTWAMQTDFFNDTEVPGAKAAFMRAFDNWVCETGINYEVNSTATAIDTAGSSTDGTNVIRFDNGSELSSGTLGICYSWYAGCFNLSGGIDWYVSELDLVFNDTTNWYTGTGTPGVSQIDFESVALHELGHSHQLAHIINPDNNAVGNNAEDVMHFSFSNGEFQRLITVNNSTAANGIQDRSTNNAVCGQDLMIDASCPLSVDETVFEESISIYPNPASSQLFIRNASNKLLRSATLFDLSGRHIVNYDISESPKVKTIDVTNISTGVYFIRIATDTASITQKLVIE
ncbi:T9SS type A sorting domain-containing protein [Hyunsoonleella pacifica]|uniref:T9SS type A sorting domain-containing protein n=1 Tax=Hyunsoonleella pacifica TaxID=1080224 RepID=A0A4Q9FRB6_9FLAO|nr:T9SS type A sorting domain-containing protein [Hyunsoonleella pacifica]TBN15796.1 T9SS type A sorting domain-containing protein [Hyunsoonleella pacifica]